MIHPDIIKRYDDMLSAFTTHIECKPNPGTDAAHLRWMLTEMPNLEDDGKAGRWLGFVQGILIERGMTTVQVERDFTRPYFSR